MINEELRRALIDRAMKDRALAAALAAEGTRHVGYHPKAETLHRDNADFLMQVFAQHGWPGRALVSDDGAAAAMMILQNAVPRPDVMRRGLELMMDAQPKGQASPLDIAFLTDRIRALEGKPQVFGTQLDWGADGQLHAPAVAEPEQVDRRRAMVGLGSLAEAVALTNREAGAHGPPADLEARRAAFQAWAQKVGWR